MAETLPDPPPVADIARIPPALFTVPARTRLGRLWFADSAHTSGFALFRRFGPTASRFDHHPERPDGTPQVHPDRAILYAVPESPGALTVVLAEVFQTTRAIDREDGEPTFSVFEVTRDLALLDVTGVFATRLGASAALSSGPRRTARRWSRALHAAYPDIDGIAYRSSMSGGSHLAFALFERAEDAMPGRAVASVRLRDSSLDQALTSCAQTLGFALC